GGRHGDGEILTSVAAGEVPVAKVRFDGAGEGAKRDVAGVVPVRVVELFEVVEVRHGDRDGDASEAQLAQLVLKRPAVEQSGEPIGERLQFSLGHDPQHAQPATELVREDAELFEAGGFHDLVRRD